VTGAAVVDESMTEKDGTMDEGDESVVVNEMSDELTKVDGSVADVASVRDGTNGTVF